MLVDELQETFSKHVKLGIGLTQLSAFTSVIPAKAGIQCKKSLTIVPILSHCNFWTPAFAAVTGLGFQLGKSYLKPARVQRRYETGQPGLRAKPVI